MAPPRRPLPRRRASATKRASPPSKKRWSPSPPSCSSPTGGDLSSCVRWPPVINRFAELWIFFPRFLADPHTLPSNPSGYRVSVLCKWVRIRVMYLVTRILFERKKLEYPGEKKNGSLRGEDEINSNETNVTFSWMESKRKKDFVGGLWTVAHSRNFEWLFRILSGDSACRWYYRKWTARFIGEI